MCEKSFAVPVLLVVRVQGRVERMTLLHLAQSRPSWFAVVCLDLPDSRQSHVYCWDVTYQMILSSLYFLHDAAAAEATQPLYSMVSKQRRRGPSTDCRAPSGYAKVNQQ